ncbi:unnamed protein product [Colias eurytheme]|nr:unnamed protein product [Colias eurytheme]
MTIYLKLIIIFEALVHCDSESPNVGSVLFSSSDVGKEQWTTSELEALQARRYFQNLIPPPQIGYSLNNEYLVNLVNYFENCYSTINKEATSLSEQEVMDMALSDAIGGYIKVWILPITKYSYYAGTISSDNAIKIFKLFGNIKRNLNTDGTSWHGPNEDLLQSVTIDIAPKPHEWHQRSRHDACNRLAYYEKTDNGLTIPLPYINWGLNPQTMFVPLKNQSLVHLMSPNSSTALLDYYIVAASCLNTDNLDNDTDFGSRFQIWLASDVIPHLSDDNLYVAFGSVLSLLNKTKNFYKDIVHFCDDKYTSLQNKVLESGCPVSWPSKKIIIIIILLFLEIIWCIPALCCLWSHKKKRKPVNVCKCFKRKRKPNPLKPFKHNKDNNLLPGVKLFLLPRTRNLEVDVELPSYGPKYVTVKSLKSSKEKVTHINEIPKRPSFAKIVPSYRNPLPSLEENISLAKQHICPYAPIRGILKDTKYSKSVPLLPDLHSSKTMTLIQEQEIKNISYTHASISLSKSVCKCVSMNTDNDKKSSIQNDSSEKYASITDNKSTDVVPRIVMNKTKENIKAKSNKSITKSGIGTRSRSLTIRQSVLEKTAELKTKSKNDTNNASIEKSESQTIIEKKSLPMDKARSKRNMKYEDQQHKISKVPKILKPKKSYKLEERNKHQKESPIIALNKKDKHQIEIQNKQRFPGIFRPTNATKSDKKDKSVNEHASLNIKIYNNQNDRGRKSDIAKPIQEKSKRHLSKEYNTLNINIDNPQTDIEVDITSFRSSKVKPSKIPRRIIFKADNGNINATSPHNNKEFPGSTKTLCKSVKTTLDDTAIQKVSKKNDKLNTTL